MKRFSLLAVVALAVLMLVGAPVRAQQSGIQNALLDHLTGQWVLQGTMAGHKATFDVDAEWVMQHSYVRLHEVSREKGANGAPVYEGTLYLSWSKSKAQYGCVFMDTGGDVGLLNLGFGKATGNSIPLVYKGDGEEFHATMVYSPASDSWAWRWDSIRNGKPEPFGRLTLTRARSAAAGHI